MKKVPWHVGIDKFIFTTLFFFASITALYHYAHAGLGESVPVALTDVNMEFAALEPELNMPGLTEINEESYIKWMSFEVPLEVLRQAYDYDVNSYNTDMSLNWVELLAYGAAENWGSFAKGRKCTAIDDLVKKLKDGERLEDLTKDLELYPFYIEAYGAVLDGMVGEYIVEEDNPDSFLGEKMYVRKYGLKAFSPIAKGYSYSHFDDFGNSRTYGYKRRHLGHDLMGSIGTPIIAVEGGYVEALGWNQYGGWRIGIRSFDGKRYYYYAHLRKDRPYATGLEIGSKVQAGDVIGYLGMTGYSARENTNNIKTPHLHFGMQIIFDESQKDGINQIWIDTYTLISFLSKNKMPVTKDAETKEFKRVLIIIQ